MREDGVSNLRCKCMKFCSSCKRAYRKNKPTNKITRKKHFCKGGAKFSFQRKVALNLKKAEVVFKKDIFRIKVFTNVTILIWHFKIVFY